MDDCPRPAGAGRSVVARAAALAAVALGIRVLAAATSSLYVDEAFGYFISRRDLWQIVNSARPDNNPPLWYFLLHPLAQASRDALVLRGPSCVCGALAAAVTYLAGRVLGERVGLLGGLLVAVSYTSWLVDAQARAYGLVTLLAAIALWSMLDAGPDGRPHVGWTGLALTAVALPLLHLLGWLVDLGLLCAAVLPGTPRRGARAACFGAGLAAGVAWMAYGALATTSALHPRALAGNGLSEILLLPAVLSGLLLPLHWGTPAADPWWAGALSALVALAIVGSGVALVRHRRREGLTIGLFVLVPLLGLVMGAAAGLQPYQNRYIVPVSSGAFLLLAYGAAGAPNRRFARPLLVLTALMGVSNLATAAVFPTDRALHNQDWASAAAWIARRELPGDVIVASIPYSIVGLDFYYHPGQIDVDFSTANTMRMQFSDAYDGAEQLAVPPSMVDAALVERLRGRRIFLVLNQVDEATQHRLRDVFGADWTETDRFEQRSLASWGHIVICGLAPSPHEGQRSRPH